MIECLKLAHASEIKVKCLRMRSHRRALIGVGLDSIHNPEFTTCEFYRAYADLEELIATTEKMIYGLSQHTDSLIRDVYKSLNPQVKVPNPPFQRLDFIPAVEAAIGRSLPDLESPDAVPELLQIFQDRNISPPSPPTLPRLVDKLSANYLEPQCSAPTFIVHHPECISPLSKSFTHPETERRVAARAELFVNGQELVNMYEEENSPFEQRRKFVEQLRHRGGGDDAASTGGACSCRAPAESATCWRLGR